MEILEEFRSIREKLKSIDDGVADEAWQRFKVLSEYVRDEWRKEAEERRDAEERKKVEQETMKKKIEILEAEKSKVKLNSQFEKKEHSEFENEEHTEFVIEQKWKEKSETIEEVLKSDSEKKIDPEEEAKQIGENPRLRAIKCRFSSINLSSKKKDGRIMRELRTKKKNQQKIRASKCDTKIWMNYYRNKNEKSIKKIIEEDRGMMRKKGKKKKKKRRKKYKKRKSIKRKKRTRKTQRHQDRKRPFEEVQWFRNSMEIILRLQQSLAGKMCSERKHDRRIWPWREGASWQRRRRKNGRKMCQRKMMDVP